AAGNRRPARRQGLRPGLAILGGRRLYAGVLRLGQAHRSAGRAAEELHRVEGPAIAAPGGEESARTRAERVAAELRLPQPFTPSSPHPSSASPQTPSPACGGGLGWGQAGKHRGEAAAGEGHLFSRGRTCRYAPESNFSKRSRTIAASLWTGK